MQADEQYIPFELDHLYNEIDKLYHQYARGCGLSDCAYWMLYDVTFAGGKAPVQDLTSSWSYSKQTISSALKVLEERGLIELAFAEGSRKSKVATLTAAGAAFSEAHIVPAAQAEQRAFMVLSAQEQRELVRLVRRYAEALHEQIHAAAPDAAAVGSAAAGRAGG